MSDDGAFAQVEFFDGVTLIGTATTSPYTFNWTNAAQGAHSVTARATNNAGLTTISPAVGINVTNAPAVALTSPANNATYAAPASIPLSANATNDGSITQVEFYNDANTALACTPAGT